MTGMTRGPLPARVYWVRRLMVLGIALLLVVGIAKMLGGSGGAAAGGAGADRARTVADTSTTQASSGATPEVGPSSGPAGPAIGAPTHHRRGHAASPVTRVAMPSGPCQASDVAVSPSVPKPIAGRDITLVLDVSSISTPACTWQLSPSSLALKITSGSDLIWTTAECARQIPTQDLVLRQAAPVRVRLTWNAERSEPGCPARTQWAMPGTYHLHVAALGGSPQDTPFLLVAPSPPQVTRTAHPHQGHTKTKKG
jgi:hypothetical protein